LAAAARTELSTQIQSEKEALIAQYEAQLDAVRAEKQNSMYTGLGGGLVAGLVIGYLISYYMARQREVSAI
jgi:predicted lipid-binding transport protein (Tim44 family)